MTPQTQTASTEIEKLHDELHKMIQCSMFGWFNWTELSKAHQILYKIKHLSVLPTEEQTTQTDKQRLDWLDEQKRESFSHWGAHGWINPSVYWLIRRGIENGSYEYPAELRSMTIREAIDAAMKASRPADSVVSSNVNECCKHHWMGETACPECSVVCGNDSGALPVSDALKLLERAYPYIRHDPECPVRMDEGCECPVSILMEQIEGLIATQGALPVSQGKWNDDSWEEIGLFSRPEQWSLIVSSHNATLSPTLEIPVSKEREEFGEK